MSNSDYAVSIPKLLDRLDVHPKSIVILNVSDDTPKDQVKVILNTVLESIPDGTLCVIGDCEFNTHKSNIDNLVSLTQKERDVLSSSHALQLLGLRHDSHFSNHPSLSIGCVGHYARYLTRHQSFDFPYGQSSMFNDLFSLNAIYLSVGEVKKPYALKYAYSGSKEVIVRNVCAFEKASYGYLDFLVNYDKLYDLQKSLSLHESGDIIIYGEKYPWLIEQVQAKL